MDWSKESIKKILFNSLVPIVCCILLGLIRYGWIIFSFHSHSFVFIAYGIIGSLFFFTLRDLGLRQALFVALILAFASELLTKPQQSPLRFVSGLLFVAALIISIFVYYKYFYLKNRRSLLNPFVLLFVLVMLFHIVQLGFTLIHPVKLRLTWGFWFEIFGSLIPTAMTGFGIGIGIWISDHSKVNALLHRLNKKAE
jgi:hypothetical protein